jgi:hypothetical protein
MLFIGTCKKLNAIQMVDFCFVAFCWSFLALTSRLAYTQGRGMNAEMRYLANPLVDPESSTAVVKSFQSIELPTFALMNVLIRKIRQPTSIRNPHQCFPLKHSGS